MEQTLDPLVVSSPRGRIIASQRRLIAIRHPR